MFRVIKSNGCGRKTARAKGILLKYLHCTAMQVGLLASTIDSTKYAWHWMPDYAY